MNFPDSGRFEPADLQLPKPLRYQAASSGNHGTDVDGDRRHPGHGVDSFDMFSVAYQRVHIGAHFTWISIIPRDASKAVTEGYHAHAQAGIRADHGADGSVRRGDLYHVTIRKI